MAKEELKNIVIPEIPADEKILKEGAAAVKMLYYKPWLIYQYKFAITEKGIWMRCPKVMLAKQKTSFTAFSNIAYYDLNEYDGHTWVILFLKEGDTLYRTYFDDMDGAVKVISEFLPRKS